MFCGISQAAGAQAPVCTMTPLLRQTEISVVDRQCRTCKACLKSCPLGNSYTNPGCLSVEPIVNQDCIACGACYQRCPHKAVDYQDDIELFLDELAAGRTLSLLVAPAVRRHFPDYRQLFGFLKTLGVESFYNVLLRADITIWAYLQILRRKKDTPFISSPCAAVNNYIIYHAPRLKEHLMPVYSPLQCTAIYLRKYNTAVSEPFAFLSPCIAKRGEIRRHRTNQYGIKYSVTINRLKQYLHTAGINLANYEPVDFTDSYEGNGLTLGAHGGVCECFAEYLPAGRYQKISGTGSVYNFLAGYQSALLNQQTLPTLLEVYNCAAGCDSGTGVGAYPGSSLTAGGGKPSTSQTQNAESAFQRFDRELDLADFIWK
ncbi:MAG: [FeFe] hydrogenase, group [Sporomusa sp.]|nr:[FeFe] hydrogenase, group [Sporomusa sp.]